MKFNLVNLKLDGQPEISPSVHYISYDLYLAAYTSARLNTHNMYSCSSTNLHDRHHASESLYGPTSASAKLHWRSAKTTV